MPDLDKESLFTAWLDGTLTDEQRQQFEACCSDDEEFSGMVAAANMAEMESSNYQPVQVPDWDRADSFDLPPEKKWWQWQGLPGLSFATSMVAIVMVMTGTNVQLKDDGLTIRFGSGQDDAAVEAIVARQLADFQVTQQQALNSYAQALQSQQLETNTQLTNYLLTSSRQERREDFAELIKFVNQQRNDDQQFYARQLNKLETQIFSNTADGTWPGGQRINDLEE